MKQYCLGLAAAFTAFATCAATVESPTEAVAPRPGMFAAASAPFAKRLSVEQRDEWRFLKEAAAAARFEHDASKLAVAKSQDPKVRALAATLLDHHAATLPSLQAMLQSRHMAPPMLANDQRKALNRMARLNGRKFDREWIERVGVRSQQGSLQTFERAAASARDPQLRGWIDRTLPAMRDQMATAERIVHGNTRYATLAPHIVVKSPVLPPARSVAAKFSEPSIR